MMKSSFSLREVARIFGLTESRLRYWNQTGFISPQGGPNPKSDERDRRCYTFSDLVTIKAAKSLLDAGISLQRVRQNLKALREAWPQDNRALDKLRICSDGETLHIFDGKTPVEPTTGQTLLDFAVESLSDDVTRVLDLPRSTEQESATHIGAAVESIEKDAAEPLPLRQYSDRGHESFSAMPQSSEDIASSEERSACEWLTLAMEIDECPERAEEALNAYAEVLARDPSLAIAHTNMGNLYHKGGDVTAARRCYMAACSLDPEQPEAHFNLANIYAQEGELNLAVAEYNHALRLQPDFSDAHFNLALTLQKLGSRHQSQEHWRRSFEI